MFDEYHYVPVLKGRQGEYGALAEADDRVRSNITPLLEIPPIPWDFEAEAPAKSTAAHVADVAGRIERSWGEDRRIFLDAGLLSDEDLVEGRHPLALVIESSRAAGLTVVPVTGLARGDAYDAAVAESLATDGRGVCLRLESEDIEEPEDLPRVLGELLAPLGLAQGDVDLVLDLGPISAEQRWTGATVRLILAALPDSDQWRTLTLLASSFPSTSRVWMEIALACSRGRNG